MGCFRNIYITNRIDSSANVLRTDRYGVYYYYVHIVRVLKYFIIICIQKRVYENIYIKKMYNDFTGFRVARFRKRKEKNKCTQLVFNSKKKKLKTINNYYQTIVHDVFNTCRIRLMHSCSKFFHKVYGGGGGDNLLNILYFVNDYFIYIYFLLSLSLS